MKYLSICIAVIIISCGGSSQEHIETAAADDKGSNERSCLAAISDQTKWYPLSAVASLVNEPEESISQEVFKGVITSCTYRWNTDRTHLVKAGNIEMAVPAKNFIAISIENLDDAIEKASRMHKNKTFTYAEYFDGYHTPATKEEQEKIDNSIDRKAEEDNNAKVAKNLLALVKTENYTVLDDLGDNANMYVQVVPESRETRLAVLHGNVVLLVNVDISDEDADDLAAAKAVAEAVIGLCD